MFTASNYVKAESLEQAYELNQKKANVVVGGMIWLKMTRRNFQTVIDLSGLGLDYLTEDEKEIHIGAMCSLRQFETSEILKREFGAAPAECVKHLVGTQFRNCATVGGSVFLRAGFSDVLTFLLALDCEVEMYPSGRISLEEFSKMPYNREILKEIVIRKDGRKVAYQSYRHEAADFPVITCAVSCLDGVWRTAVGARPQKAMVCSVDLMDGQAVTEELAAAYAKAAAEACSYGSNMRGTGEYRRYLAEILIGRCVKEVLA